MTFADYANMLKEYFKRDISNEELCGKLFDDTSELLRQLMNLIEADRNISPTLKEKLRLQAKQESLSLFLAEAFLYAIRQKNKSAKTNREVKAEVVNSTFNSFNGNFHHKNFCLCMLILRRIAIAKMFVVNELIP